MILELHQQLKEKKISALELVEEYFKAIKAKNPELNAYLTLGEEQAKKQAQDLDKKGDFSSLLAGIPYSLKDNFCTEGIKTTAGAKILANYLPPYSATAYLRLQGAGAILLGKTNMDEFAMGASTENSAFGPSKNPHDLERVPGGSSGGSAAAVAANLCIFSLGTDTGGSIRQPAAFCGCVGLKPTYGRVSRYGVIAMASSLDTVGPLTQTVEDATIVLQTIAGHDDLDSTTPPVPVPDYLEEIKKEVKGMKVGIPKEYFGEGIEKEVKEKIEQAIARVEGLGVRIVEVSLPHTKYAIPTYYIIVPAEVSSNLARYDGLRYGQQIKGKNLLETYLKSRSQGLGAESKRRIMLGTYTLSAGYYEAYYLKAMKVRTLIRKDFSQAFAKVDVLLTPTTPTVAFKLDEKTTDPLQMYLADIFTCSANLAGISGISLPVGKVDHLPVGLQILGPQFDEAKVLRLAYYLEKCYN